MKLANVAFDTARRGGAIAIAPPPSGASERELWKLRGDVVQSPACFPRSALLTTPRVKLTCELHSNPAPTQPIWIRAEPRYEPHIFGAIDPIKVQPARWSGTYALVSASIGASKLRQAGVGHHRATWQWYWGYERDDINSRLGRSEHLLFVTVKPSTNPWTRSAPAPDLQTTPWMTALRQACEWGRGAKTERQAAERIVQAFFALGVKGRGKKGFRYYPDGFRYLDAGLAHPRFFDLESFLADVASDQPDQIFQINCIEGATIAATFANLLGCSLDPCVIEAPSCEDSFLLNRIRPLGQKSDKFIREFTFHVVAADRARLANLRNARIFDTTMKIDSDKRPAKRPHKFVLATGMSLGSKRSLPGKAKYFPQLIDRTSLNGTSARRVAHAMVRKPDNQTCVEICPLTRFVKYLKELLLDAGPPVLRAPAPDTPDIGGYARELIFSRRPGIPRVGLPRVPERTLSIYRGQTGRMIQLDQWTDPDPFVNLFFMAELLAMSEVPPVRIDPRVPLYTVPGAGTITAFVGGAVVRFASVGATQLNMVTVFDNVTWPIALRPGSRSPVAVTKPKARRSRKR